LFNNYPIIKQSSKRDSFVKKTKNSKIEIILNTDIENFIESEKINKVY
jgi:hypothetical protein